MIIYSFAFRFIFIHLADVLELDKTPAVEITNVGKKSSKKCLMGFYEKKIKYLT